MREIKFTYKNEEYTLCFTRKSVKTLESQGFDIQSIASKPMTTIPQLFYGSFLAKHTGIKRNLVDEMWDEIGNKTDLIATLTEMYADTLNSLLEDNEKNLTWEVTK